MTSPYLSITASHPNLQTVVANALEISMPSQPRSIGLVGCGWIGGMQLSAYREQGFDVVALCDRNPEKAENLRSQYFPRAEVYQSVDDLLRHPSVQVVDVATHLAGRPETIRRSLEARKSVLSQKPFVADLSTGSELSALAQANGVTLAVNQNGRWAPHFGAMMAMVQAGLIGQVVSADFQVAWPHDEIVADMPAFASMQDLILFDFGAHWFDIVGALTPNTALVVYASTAIRPGQTISAPLQASAVITGDGFVATITFRAGERFAETGSYRIAGTAGVITHTGRSLGGQGVELHNADGHAHVETDEDWFRHGLAGAMRSLLVALEQNEVPSHSPGSAMRGLSIAFAALESARSGAPVEVGAATKRV